MQGLPPPSTQPPSADVVEISVFGPGYGECVVVHLGDGEWLVVDSCTFGRGGAPAALTYLDEIGVDVPTQVVLVVATHWHDDHVRGLRSVVEEAPQAQVWMSAAIGFAELMALTLSANLG
ncbi:MAG: MBL fold metallo-hydrolase [Sporichthyaceae bacterium]